MLNLENHPYFEKYTDPKSGVESFILRKKIAPMQQHLYFAQPSITTDGKYLWVRCSYPPAQVQTMAAISLDPENPSFTHYPQAALLHNGDYPAITPEQDGLYIPHDSTVYKLTLDGKMTPIITLSWDLQKNRPCEMLMTHASVSCDNKYIGLDMRLSDKWYICIGDLKTGEVKVLAPVAEISKTVETASDTKYYDNKPALVISAEGADTITLTIPALDLPTLADITGKVLISSVSCKRITLKHHNNNYIMEAVLVSSTKD